MKQGSSASATLRLLLALLALAWLPDARAALVVGADALRLPGVELTGVRAALVADPQGAPRLRLYAARAAVPALGWKNVGLRLDTAVRRLDAKRWQLDGTLALTGAPGQALRDGRVVLLVDPDNDTLTLTVAQATASVRAALPLQQPSHAQLTLTRLPLAWLQGVLAAAWPEGRLGGGRADGNLALDVLDDGIRATGDLALSAAGFDSRSGMLAGQALGLAARVGFDSTGGRTRIDVDGRLRGGELLFGPLYAKLPARPARLDVQARVRGGRIEIPQLRYDDGDALALAGSLALDADGNLTALDLGRFDAHLPAAYARYGQGWLAALGYPDLRTAGRLGGSVALRDGQPTRLRLQANAVDAADAEGRLALSGLDGSIDWDAAVARPPTTLGWRGIHLYRVPLGAGRMRVQGRDGQLQTLAPVDVPLLRGTLNLQSLALRPAASAPGRLALSLAVTGVDMPALCRALGWPPFQGKLGGAIPSLRYVDDRVELAGGLSLNVFDGFVDVTDLSVQHPFGDAPVLDADIALRGLDLEKLTGVFDVGKITGRMDGRIGGLKLLDWSPVAFAAELHAEQGGRISQRAVKSLTDIGGGGFVAGLQARVLKMFDSFGYRRIGLSCTLSGNVCRMGGVDSGNDGYTIVEGRGLPYIKVVGHQQQVDWSVLVARVKAAASGSAPVVQ
ncbi:MAG: hypothetical protein ABFC67_03200 [Mizugakiibacter sp.]|uniref:hypothetical protein n=1 Tax=Mizugakiibacter sp. TaxID=1972610 RepID=UPI0031C864FA|nr:hypothetical protein [Xanthomonadaceae bacterium]